MVVVAPFIMLTELTERLSKNKDTLLFILIDKKSLNQNSTTWSTMKLLVCDRYYKYIADISSDVGKNHVRIDEQIAADISRSLLEYTHGVILLHIPAILY